MTRKIKSRSESVFSAIFLLCQVRKTNCGKDSCFAGLFSVISRLSGVALAKTDVSRAKEIVILAGLLLAVNVSAQTPYYYLNRSFSSVQFNLQGIPTEYQLNEESDKLTDIVQGSIQLDTTGTYAIERQAAITICYNLSEDAWNAAVNYTGSTSIYTGKIFNNVGWVRGIKNTTPSTWGAYLWVLQNRIAFQASTSAWWSTTNGIPVAITNVMVGSLGDYQATSNVVDIGPHLNVATNNYPGANQSESKEFQVDITNVYYVLVIPDIWITPRFAVTCVDGSNVQYSVTGTNIPQGMTWTLIPDLSGSGGAAIQSNGAWQAEVAPGSVATNYIVRATSKDNTNFYDQVSLDVVKVELVPTNRVGCPHCLTNLVYSLTNSFVPNGVTWSIYPSGLSGGATVTPNGNQAAVSAGTVGTNYAIRVTSVDCTNCYAEAGLAVYVPGNIVQTNNFYDDTTNTNESHKVIRHQFSPTPAGDAANHFCFVQRLKGSFKYADGSYMLIGTMYGNSNVPCNFTNWVIDSVDDDPAYWSGYPHYNHESAGGNVYYVEDDPGPALSTETGCVYNVDFTIGTYCTNEVPANGCAAQPSTGTPFDTAAWDYKVTVTTNGTFTHP